MWLTASITEPVANWAIGIIEDIGLWGIFLLMAPESAMIPIPSEPTMLFAGFSVAKGEYGLWAAALVATFANLVGSWAGYAVGYYGRASVLTRNRLFHVNDAQLARSERWFERYGAATVFFSRMLPVVRTFISLPAGIAKMNIWTFSILTFLGALPWNLGLVLLGREAAAKWPEWRDRLSYVDYTVAALIVLGAIYLFLRWRRNRGGPAGATA